MITQDDIRALKAYVAAPGTQSQAESTVRLNVSHSNLKAHFMEIRLDLHVCTGVLRCLANTGFSLNGSCTAACR